VLGKQTYVQLAAQHGCSVRTIQRRIDKVVVKKRLLFKRKVIVLMDTTYWGREFGVMLFKDAIAGENLLKYYVKSETIALYKQGITTLQQQGFTILAIVCDGKKGLQQGFGNIPVQMCQFHQVAIVTRYLTRKPKLQAALELRAIVLMLVHTDKESFVGAVLQWHTKWELFLNERYKSPVTGKSHYTHRKLRSAYKSLKTNMTWLFTWYDLPELRIPNTTNAIDGHFADLKNKLRNHNGLSIQRKKKFIDEFLKA
jgi:hypothetical protein